MCLHCLRERVVPPCKMVHKNKVVLLEGLCGIDGLQGVLLVHVLPGGALATFLFCRSLWSFAFVSPWPSLRPGSPRSSFCTVLSQPFFLFGHWHEGWPGESQMVHRCSLATLEAQDCPGGNPPRGGLLLFQLKHFCFRFPPPLSVLILFRSELRQLCLVRHRPSFPCIPSCLCSSPGW